MRTTRHYGKTSVIYRIIFYKNNEHVPFKDALAMHEKLYGKGQTGEDVFVRRVQESVDTFLESGKTVTNEYDDGITIVVEGV